MAFENKALGDPWVASGGYEWSWSKHLQYTTYFKNFVFSSVFNNLDLWTTGRGFKSEIFCYQNLPPFAVLSSGSNLSPFSLPPCLYHNPPHYGAHPYVEMPVPPTHNENAKVGCYTYENRVSRSVNAASHELSQRLADTKDTVTMVAIWHCSEQLPALFTPLRCVLLSPPTDLFPHFTVNFTSCLKFTTPLNLKVSVAEMKVWFLPNVSWKLWESPIMGNHNTKQRWPNKPVKWIDLRRPHCIQSRRQA